MTNVVKVRKSFAAYGNHMEWLEGDSASLVVGFGTGAANGFVLTGTIPGGFKSTDGLCLYGAPTTATGSDFQASMSLASYVTTSTDTTITIGDGIENDSEKPDDDWQDKACKFVLIRDGVEYPLLASFKNPIYFSRSQAARRRSIS